MVSQSAVERSWTSANPDSVGERRKERKRQTDRVAQREHRKRQKQYLADLEARISFAARDDGSELSKALAEIERLRKELETYKKAWASIAQIVATLQGTTSGNKDVTPLDDHHNHHHDHAQQHNPQSPPLERPAAPAEDPEDPEDPEDQQQFAADGAAGSAESLPTPPFPRTHGFIASNTHDNIATPHVAPLGTVITPPSCEIFQNLPATVLEGTQQSTEENVTTATAPPAPSVSYEHQYMGMSDELHPPPVVENWWSTSNWSNLLVKGLVSSSMLPDSSSGMVLDGSGAIGFESDSGSSANGGWEQSYAHRSALSPQSADDTGHVSRSWIVNDRPLSPRERSFPLETYGSLLLTSTLPSAPSPVIRPRVLNHRHLPQFSTPPPVGDAVLQELVDDLRARKVPVARPTLDDFFYDNPDNPLSLELKTYLEPLLRRRRVVEYAATYWMVYLLIRWYVNVDEESFQALPLWMRPTHFQIAIEHPISVNFIVWPELRNELLMAGIVNPQRVTKTQLIMASHVEIDLDATQVSLTHDPEAFFAAISDLKNWKLQEDFFCIYPQWSSICDGRG